ncbi:MAG: beta-lactamase family protein, partial [Gemmatimonadetes bacterium]|nr:beta-lactamase family protein [Gemmatimonadota bacterium]
MKFRHLLRLVLVGLAGAACAELDRSSQFDGFDEFLDSLMAEHGVPGLSFAAFDDREVLYHHAAGYKNQETKEIVDTQTAFEAASISKPVFAYVVLTLVRDGIVDLDMPLSAFGLGLPELTHDVRFDILTPRMLLAHLGGLPNWRARINFQAKSYEQLFSPDDTLEFVVDPNTEYRYSGEGYVLLQQVIEHVTGKGLNELAGEIVFGPLAMARSSFLYD